MELNKQQNRLRAGYAQKIIRTNAVFENILYLTLSDEEKEVIENIKNLINELSKSLDNR